MGVFQASTWRTVADSITSRVGMIIFDLSCKQEHVFEGWFRSQANYDSQLKNGLIACPHCGSIEIRRVPSAVHLAKTANSPAPKANDVSAPVTHTEGGRVAA